MGAFKKIFGGRAHRGTRPEKFATGSGAIARHILRQLEALKIVEHIPEGKEGHRKGCVRAPAALRRPYLPAADDRQGDRQQPCRSSWAVGVAVLQLVTCLVLGSFGAERAAADTPTHRHTGQRQPPSLPADASLATGRRRITPQGQRDLDSIAGQIGAK